MSDVNFKGGYREIAYRYELLNGSRVPIADISDQVVSAEITHNAFSTIKRTAKFNIKEKTGTVPDIVATEYANSWWHPDFPWKNWDSTDNMNYKFGTLMHPVYKVYSGDWNEFHNPVSKTVGSGEGKPWVGTYCENWNPIFPNAGASKVTMSRETGGPTGNIQVLQGDLTASDLFSLETSSSSSIPVTTKRVYFTGYFKSADYVKPVITIRYSGGTNPQEFVRIPDANITTVSLAGTNDWKFYEGYVDVSPHNDYTIYRLGVGIGGFSIAKEIRYASFYYDAAKKDNTNFKFINTATSPVIDTSIKDVLNVANKFRQFSSLASYNIHYAQGITGLSELTNKLEIRFSTNGGTSWSSYYDLLGWQSNLAENTDVRNMRVQLKYSCSAYTQFDLPWLNSWKLSVGALTNMQNRNKDGIDYIKNYIKPYLQINDNGVWKEYPLGVFMLSSPKRSDGEGVITREVDAYDLLTILDQVKLVYPITVFPHETGGWGRTVKNILKGTYSSNSSSPSYFFGRTFDDNELNIPDSNPVPKSRGRNFPIGETLLNVLNELLTAGNCTRLYCDSLGVITSENYVSPQDKPVVFNYIDNEMSIIFTQADEEIDTFNTANVFVAVQQATPDGAQLISRYFNFDAGHPSSIPTQNRYIVDYREVDNMETQEELDNYVRRTAYEASQAYGQIHFNTALDPGHEHMQNVYLRYQDLQIDGKFTETAWTMHLNDDPHMEHRLRRIATI